jgi:hypothetical protein
MSQLEQSIGAARNPEEVWGVVGNFDADARWRFVEEMRSDPPVRPASAPLATHEVLRFMGSTYVSDAAVTSVVGPGRHLTFAGGGEGTIVRGYRRVEEAPDGARFVQGLEIRLSELMRLLEPLLARLYACRMRLAGSPRPQGAPRTTVSCR